MPAAKIIRQNLSIEVERAMAQFPVTSILGPRQCGKTTLARQLAGTRPSTFFDLELPSDRARLAQPELMLSSLTGLVVLDEVQQRPELFSVLRPLADRAGPETRYLLLGSAAPSLIKGVSESLAGRAATVDVSGFTLDEVGAENLKTLWQRGGFPKSYLADSEPASLRWRQEFIRSFLERDLPQLGITVPAETMLRFWTMLAHYHGQTWNGSELSRSLAINDKSLRRYLDLLTGAQVIRQLQPWHENLGKRQVKAPKLYLRDSGLLHALLGVSSWPDLLGHPKFGASWEGFAVEQILQRTRVRQAFFWGTHAGAELDLLLMINGLRVGIEIKAAASPVMTRSLAIARADLKLDRAFIVHPGASRYPVAPGVEAVPLPALLEELPGIG